MTILRYFLLFATACLFIVLLPESVRAQDSMGEVKTEFCADVSEESNEALDDLGEATFDLADCAVEFDDCGTGLFDSDPASCLVDFFHCTAEANQDQQRACDFFARRLENTFEEAMQDARQVDSENGEKRFLLFLNRRNGQQCLEPAKLTATVCAGLTL